MITGIILDDLFDHPSDLFDHHILIIAIWFEKRNVPGEDGVGQCA